MIVITGSILSIKIYLISVLKYHMMKIIKNESKDDESYKKRKSENILRKSKINLNGRK